MNNTTYVKHLDIYRTEIHQTNRFQQSRIIIIIITLAALGVDADDIRPPSCLQTVKDMAPYQHERHLL